MRFFADIPLEAGSLVELPDELTHHLVKVLRAEDGEHFFIFNGQGGHYEAELKLVSKRVANAQLLSFVDTKKQSPLHTHIGQVMSRGERMDYAIQKATEMGVTEITPLTSERCELKLRGEDRSDKKIEHWRKVAISACEQCGRDIVPVIHAPIALTDWIAQTQADRKFVMAPAVTGGPVAGESVNSVAVLIGPEGGLSENEITLAQNAGFNPWQLGPRVLRTETAPVAALAVLQWLYGDYISALSSNTE